MDWTQPLAGDKDRPLAERLVLPTVENNIRGHSRQLLLRHMQFAAEAKNWPTVYDAHVAKLYQ